MESAENVPLYPAQGPAMDFEEDEGFPPEPAGVPLMPASPQAGRRPVKARRYEILRTISLWFKVLAGVIAFVYFAALAILGRLVLAAPPGEAKWEAFFLWVATSITGITVVMLVYAFAVLLLVAMDIEYNTREE